MHSLIFDQVSFAYSGGDEILHDISLTFTAGWSAIIGDNGAGKSTLLRIAEGSLAPVRGNVRRANLAAVTFVDQRVDDAGTAVLAFAASRERDAARWRGRLGLDAAELARWSTLSPGERKRWQLAAALAGDPDVLIIDEPTNHLDADALGRCIDALARFEGVGLLVSHDRDVLDRLAQQTVRLHGGTARSWPGGYTAAREAWEAEQRSARARRELASTARAKAERRLADARRREHAASRGVSRSARSRGRYDSDARAIGATNLASWAAARAGREVESSHTRVTAARDAEAAIVVERERGAALSIGWEPASRRWLAQLDCPELRAGERVLARDVRVAVGRDDRIWLRGANGAGKTTLLRALVAACTLPDERVFVLPQDLDLEAGAELARAIRMLDRATRGRLGQLADALGVDPDRAVRSDAPSPGETRKLALAFGLTRRPYVVVLDEPTNHLDLPSIERLEEALAAYPGAVLLVSHDQRLATALCTTTWTVADGAVVAGGV